MAKKLPKKTLYFLTQKRSVKYVSSDGPTSLYDVLGVSPKATHKEIKSAYYDLSMTYHPDKNRDNAAAEHKFREVTAAYEILGNFLNRRKYDRGIMTPGVGGASPRDDDPPADPRSWDRAVKPRVQTQTGHSHIYNFDEWTREHYGATFARSVEKQKNSRQKAAQANTDNEERRTELMMTLIAVAVILASISTTRTTFDVPQPVSEKDNTAEK